jgi:hypothetical protein
MNNENLINMKITQEMQLQRDNLKLAHKQVEVKIEISITVTVVDRIISGNLDQQQTM